MLDNIQNCEVLWHVLVAPDFVFILVHVTVSSLDCSVSND
jgi:hypothetical protein